mmetsp:Transcript_13730/g.21310  ORF Transcript_13730/g.21310 Transcript_13730/m.21310 type:complete len:109 (+) Transcript_13730:1293-1619(+)
MGGMSMKLTLLFFAVDCEWGEKEKKKEMEVDEEGGEGEEKGKETEDMEVDEENNNNNTNNNNKKGLALEEALSVEEWVYDIENDYKFSLQNAHLFLYFLGFLNDPEEK